MANKHETLSSLFSAIANAIRGKTGTSETIVADDFPSAIEGIEMGVTLPELTNPAAAGNIQAGFEAVDGEGNVVTGTGAMATCSVEHIKIGTNKTKTVYVTNPPRNKFYAYGSGYNVNQNYGFILSKDECRKLGVNSYGYPNQVQTSILFEKSEGVVTFSEYIVGGSSFVTNSFHVPGYVVFIDED